MDRCHQVKPNLDSRLHNKGSLTSRGRHHLQMLLCRSHHL
jgi:hypothetical protein